MPEGLRLRHGPLGEEAQTKEEIKVSKEDEREPMALFSLEMTHHKNNQMDLSPNKDSPKHMAAHFP